MLDRKNTGIIKKAKFCQDFHCPQSLPSNGEIRCPVAYDRLTEQIFEITLCSAYIFAELGRRLVENLYVYMPMRCNLVTFFGDTLYAPWKCLRKFAQTNIVTVNRYAAKISRRFSVFTTAREVMFSEWSRVD